MPQPVTVSISGLFRAAPTLRRRWADVAALVPAFHRIRAASWLVPLPTAASVTGAVQAIAGKRPKGRPPPAFRLLAQPGAAGAVLAWGARVEAVDREAPVVALVGPPLVDAAVEQAVAAGLRVAVVCPSEGEVVEPPLGGVWVDDAWAGEGARSVLGVGVLSVASSHGVDVAAGLRGAAGMLADANEPLAHNPIWSLARALRVAAAELGRDGVVHLAAPELESLAAWAARSQATVLSAPSAAVAARPLPVRAELGDEDWLRAISECRDVVVVVWQFVGSTPPALDSLGAEGTPVLLVQLATNDAESRGAAFALWLSVLQVLAVLEQRAG